MADIAERMKSLRGVARADAQPAAAPEMDKFRADFKLVWQWRLRSGWFSLEEFGPIYDHAGRAVRDNSGDREWMACAMRDFAEQAADIRASIARSERIRDEVRREKAELPKIS